MAWSLSGLEVIFLGGRLRSLGQQWRGSQGDEVPFLMCVRGVGDISCLCSLGGLGWAGKQRRRQGGFPSSLHAG